MNQKGGASHEAAKGMNHTGNSTFYKVFKKNRELKYAILQHRHQSDPRRSIDPGTPLTFAGADDPAAFVRLKSIGLARDRCTVFSEKICGFIHQELGVPINRIFIDFKDLEGSLFGWNGKTF